MVFIVFSPLCLKSKFEDFIVCFQGKPAGQRTALQGLVPSVTLLRQSRLSGLLKRCYSEISGALKEVFLIIIVVITVVISSHFLTLVFPFLLVPSQIFIYFCKDLHIIIKLLVVHVRNYLNWHLK